MYNINLVRQLCTDIAAERDPQKEKELISLMQAVIKDEQEEIRVRMQFLAKKYSVDFSQSNAAD